MRPKLVRAISTMIFLLMTACWSSGGSPDDGPSPQLASIAGDCEAGRIGRIELLRIRGDKLFRTRVTPELLDKWFEYKLTVTSVESIRKVDLINELRTTRVRSSNGEPDVRWGIVFYDVAGNARAGSIYFDNSGKSGYIENLKVGFELTLLQRLKRIATEGFE